MTHSGIETYPVGALADLQRLHRLLRVPKARLRDLGAPPTIKRDELRRFIRTLAQSWRAKSYWNGYLAEWAYPPATLRLPKAGTGWTRRRALRRFARHIIDANQIG